MLNIIELSEGAYLWMDTYYQFLLNSFKNGLQKWVVNTSGNLVLKLNSIYSTCTLFTAFSFDWCVHIETSYDAHILFFCCFFFHSNSHKIPSVDKILQLALRIISIRLHFNNDNICKMTTVNCSEILNHRWHFEFYEYQTFFLAFSSAV